MAKQTTAIIPALPRGVTRIEPDGPRFKNIFHINSESSDRVYRVSYDSASGAGWWACSCRGWISHGRCKHLETIGLRPTRADILGKRVTDGSSPQKTSNPQQKRLR